MLCNLLLSLLYASYLFLLFTWLFRLVLNILLHFVEIIQGHFMVLSQANWKWYGFFHNCPQYYCILNIFVYTPNHEFSSSDKLIIYSISLMLLMNSISFPFLMQQYCSSEVGDKIILRSRTAFFPLV